MIQRLQAALPLVSEWIDDYLARHEQMSRPVASLGMTRLAASYPEHALRNARVALVERVEFPPVDRFGLPEFAAIQQQTFGGITFKNMYFLRIAEAADEGLHFHEMVHVIQWARLGVERFLLTYGIGLAEFGYEHCPPESTWLTNCNSNSKKELPAPNWSGTSRLGRMSYGVRLLCLPRKVTRWSMTVLAKPEG
jgi:hypothetical protein